MTWPFRRQIGPRPPGLISRAFTAMLNRAPLKEWTRLGAGIAIAFIFLAVAAAVRFGWPAGTEHQRLNIMFAAICFSGVGVLVAMVSTFDINLKINANEKGFTGDFSHDEEEPTKARIEGDLTITPKAEGAE